MMKPARLFVSSAAFCCLALGLAALARTSPRSTQAASLDTIKALAGDWVAAEQAGDPAAPVQSSIRVTSAGHAVLETLFPGTAHEMVTIYHMDGTELVLTHYCSAGNQPHYKASRGASEHELIYTCQGGANIRSADDAHMHEGRLTIVDEHHFRSEWKMFEKGACTETASFDLVRVRR